VCEAHRRQILTRSLGLGFGAIGLMVAGQSLAQQDQTPAKAGQKWVCPPCGCPSDGKDFDEEGVCPSCSMPLMRKPAPAESTKDPAPPPGRP